VGEGARRHTDGEEERAKETLLSPVSPTEGVDGREGYVQRVEVFSDPPKDGDPNGRNVGTAYGARLTDDALLLGALANFPSRAGLVDTGRTAGVEIRPGIGVDQGGGQRGGGDGRLVLVLLKVQAELCERRVNVKGVGRHWAEQKRDE